METPPQRSEDSEEPSYVHVKKEDAQMFIGYYEAKPTPQKPGPVVLNDYQPMLANNLFGGSDEKEKLSSAPPSQKTQITQ